MLKYDTAENKRFQDKYLHCSVSHYVYICKQFRVFSFSEKCQQVKRLGLCGLCLNPGHIASNCISDLKCRKSDWEKITHNTMLYPPDASGRGKKPVDEEDAAFSSLAENDSTTANVKRKSLAAYCKNSKLFTPTTKSIELTTADNN